DHHPAAQPPADQRHPRAVHLRHAGEPVHGGADVFGLFLRHHPAALALRGAEPAVVEGQHGEPAGGQRPGEPGRVDHLLPQIPRARDHHRVPHLPGAAIAGQVQVGIQAQPARKKRQRPGNHPRPRPPRPPPAPPRAGAGPARPPHHRPPRPHPPPRPPPPRPPHPDLRRPPIPPPPPPPPKTPPRPRPRHMPRLELLTHHRKPPPPRGAQP